MTALPLSPDADARTVSGVNAVRAVASTFPPGHGTDGTTVMSHREALVTVVGLCELRWEDACEDFWRLGSTSIPYRPALLEWWADARTTLAELRRR